MTRTRKPRAQPPIALPPDLAQLTALWNAEAANFERDGVPGHAALLRRIAHELQAVLASRDNAPLTLAQAAAESGFSVAHLRRLICMNVIRNVSENGKVQVRRGDLPRKARRQRLGPDVTAEVLGLTDAR